MVVISPFSTPTPSLSMTCTSGARQFVVQEALEITSWLGRYSSFREAAFRAPTTSTEWRQEPYILIIFVQSFGKRNNRLIALLIGSLWRWRCYRTRRLHSCSSNESVQRVQKSILHDSYRQLQDGMHVSRAQGSVVVTGREKERQIRTEA